MRWKRRDRRLVTCFWWWRREEKGDASGGRNGGDGACFAFDAFLVLSFFCLLLRFWWWYVLRNPNVHFFTSSSISLMLIVAWVFASEWFLNASFFLNAVLFVCTAQWWPQRSEGLGCLELLLVVAWDDLLSSSLVAVCLLIAYDVDFWGLVLDVALNGFELYVWWFIDRMMVSWLWQ